MSNDHEDNIRNRDHPASALRLREEGLCAWVEYQNALVGRRAGLEPTSQNGKGEGETNKGKNDKRESDRSSYKEFGGIGVLMLDVWGNQPWRLHEKGMASAKGEEGPGFHPKALLSKR